MADGAFTFQARCEVRSGAAVITARGELDLASADGLRQELMKPEATAPTVVLDLRKVTFMDSSGLSVVVAEHQRALADGFRFAIAVGGAGEVRRLFELAGLVGMLTLIDDPETFLAA
jgi:anti-anti-sigma factor